VIDEIVDLNEQAMFANNFDDALIGYVEIAGQPMRALYDYDKCVFVAMNQLGLGEDEAVEWVESMMSAYVGEGTPAFATLLERGDGELR